MPSCYAHDVRRVLAVWRQLREEASEGVPSVPAAVALQVQTQVLRGKLRRVRTELRAALDLLDAHGL